MSKYNIFLFLLITIFGFGCKSEYTQYVERELEKGIINDSLIFGMSMGMHQKDFYSICWELNRQQIISQGDGNQNAKYIEPYDSLSDNRTRKEMLFYGLFDDQNMMYGMRMKYNFVSWSPWNNDTQSTNLLNVLLKEYELKYPGNEFIKIELDGVDIDAYVKIDGNREILIYPKNDKDVMVKIRDLRNRYKSYFNK